MDYSLLAVYEWNIGPNVSEESVNEDEENMKVEILGNKIKEKVNNGWSDQSKLQHFDSTFDISSLGLKKYS